MYPDNSHNFQLPNAVSRLFVYRSASRTYTFLLQLLSAASAAIGIGSFAEHSPSYEDIEEEKEEEITHIDRGGEDEEEIAEHTRRQQSEEIEECRRSRQLPEDIVEYRHRDEDEQPQAQQKHGEYDGHMERRERGIEIEMLPRVGNELLHRLIDCRAASHQEAEEERIQTVDIAEEDQTDALSPY